MNKKKLLSAMAACLAVGFGVTNTIPYASNVDFMVATATSAVNDTTANATEVALDETVSGSITADQADYCYKIELESAGTFTLNYSSTSDMSHVKVIDAVTGSDVISRFTLSTTNNTLVSTSKSVVLNKGSYYIVINKQANNYLGDFSFSTGLKAISETIPEEQGGANNTYLKATDVALDTEYTGMLAINDTADYYKFTLDQSGKINLKFTSELDYAYVYICDENGTRVYGNYHNQTNGSEIIINDNVHLTSGVYYLEVSRYSDASRGAFTFSLNYTSADEYAAETEGGSNNTYLKASEVPLDTNINGQIAVNDYSDYYMFTLDESGKINLKFSSDILYVNIDWLDENGDEIIGDTYQYDTNSGMIILNEDIQLTSGTYYLKVSRQGTSYYGNFSFSLNYTSADEYAAETEGGSNNTYLKASEVPLDTNINGQLAVNDYADYYKFTIDESGKIDLKFSSDINYLYTILLDENGIELKNTYREYNKNSGMINLNEDIHLTAGTYYLEVSRYGSSYYGNFSFSLNYTSADEYAAETEGGSNNTTLTASILSTDTEVNGQIALNDYADYYTFNLTESNKVTLNFSGQMKNVYVYLLNENNDELDGGYYYIGANESSIEFSTPYDLKAGIYYIKVIRYGTTYYGNYTLSLTTPQYLLGDVNEDGVVDAIDASEVLTAYARLQTGGDIGLEPNQQKAADVTLDGVVDAIDASGILTYYAQISTGQTPTWN